MTDSDYARLFPRLARKYGEDIAQEALVRCWQVLVTIDHLPAYVYRTAERLKAAEARGPYKRRILFPETLPDVPARAAQFAYVELGEVVRRLPALVWDAVGYPVQGKTLLARRLRRMRYRRVLERAEEPPYKPLTGGA